MAPHRGVRNCAVHRGIIAISGSSDKIGGLVARVSSVAVKTWDIDCWHTEGPGSLSAIGLLPLITFGRYRRLKHLNSTAARDTRQNQPWL